jgi:hypothetical protein
VLVGQGNSIRCHCLREAYDAHLLLLVFAQDIAHLVAEYSPRQIQCPGPTSLAGFQLITYARFWVLTEEIVCFLSGLSQKRPLDLLGD